MEKPQELNIVKLVRGEAARSAQPELDVRRYARLVYKKRYLFVAIMILVTGVIVAVGYRLPSKYEASSMVLVEGSYANDVLKGVAVPASTDDRVGSVSTIMQSRSHVLKVLKDLNFDLQGKTEDEVEQLVESYRRATKITIDMNRSRRDVDMFTVSMRHGNPVIARDYVNALVRLYIEESLSNRHDETSGTKKFLLEQVDILKQKISIIEADIEKMNRMNVRKRSAARERLSMLRQQLLELRRTYTDKHPEIAKLEDEIALQESRVKSRQQTKGNRETGAVAGDVPAGTEQRIKELERDRDTYRKMYEEMLATLGKSEVSSRLEVQDKGGIFNVLEPAILPTRPVSPNRVLIIALGFFAGIGVAIGSVILLSSMDKSVQCEATAGTFGLPILAVFPYVRLPREIRWTRIKDVLLYAVTALYFIGVTALLTVELIG